jgi:hypothetical protein
MEIKARPHSLQASVSTFPTKGHYTLKLYHLFLYRLERGKEHKINPNDEVAAPLSFIAHFSTM